MFNASKSDSVDSNLLKVGRRLIADHQSLWSTAGGQSLVTSNGLTIADEIANVLAWRDSFLALEGDSTVGHRDLQTRLFTRYDFKYGALKGLFVGGGLTFSSEAVIGKNTVTSTFVKSPGFYDADLLLGYRLPLRKVFGRRTTLTLQFNGQNLFQEERISLVRADTDGQIFRGVINPPRRYLLNAKLSF
jgi:hypothetical protein